MKQIIKEYLKLSHKFIDNLDIEKLQIVINLMGSIRYYHGNKILIAGNGGSAATASHFAEDLNSTKKVIAVSLCNDIGFITATANDFGYDYIFERQLERLHNHGDLLIVISASGNSKNLIKSVDYVNSKGGITVGILGFNGGMLKDICKVSLVIKSPIGMYGQVEDSHLMVSHIITESFNSIDNV